MAKSSLPQEQKMYNVTMNLIGTFAKTPLVKVDREQFLQQQFANSPYLEEILLQGPQSVYKPKVLENKGTSNRAEQYQ